MLLLDVTQGLIVEVSPVANATLLPLAFWMFISLLIICVALTCLLLFGANTGLMFVYDVPQG